jgi:hypothetical protein
MASVSNLECKRSDVSIMFDHFCAWWRDAKATKQDRLLKSIYATAVVYQSIRRRRTILHSWSRWAYCRSAARRQFGHVGLALLRGIYWCWSSLAAKTQALALRVEVRRRRKLLESCLASLRCAQQRGKCRRGPVARRYFGALKWYSQSFCVDLPTEHRSGVLRRLVVQAWSRLRLLSLKMALCQLTTSRHVLRRRFIAWIAHTGNRKRAIISHRLANAHATYSNKKRFFCALKRRMVDAAREFFLLGKAVLFNSRRCLNAGFRLLRAAATAQRELGMAQHPVIESTAATAAPVNNNYEAPPPPSPRVAVFRPQPSSSSSSNMNAEQGALASLQSNRALAVVPSDATSEPARQAFRAIPVTVAQKPSAKPPSLAAKTSNVAKARQGSSAAPNPTRASHATQTTASLRPKKAALVVEVPRRQGAGTQLDVSVIGRPVVSSFLLSGLRPTVAAGLASPK